MITKKQAENHLEDIEKDLYKKGLGKKYARAGIYCIKINGVIVYIGKSRNMLVRVANHIVEIERVNPKENKYKVLQQAYYNPDIQVAFDVLYHSKKRVQKTIDEDIGKMEGVYIRQYMPALNYQIPKEENWHCFTVNKSAKTITLGDILAGNDSLDASTT